MMIDNSLAYSSEGVTSIADVPAADMTTEQRLAAAAEANLDLSLVKRRR
jgi:hypothetical protein